MHNINVQFFTFKNLSSLYFEFLVELEHLKYWKADSIKNFQFILLLFFYLLKIIY